MSNMYSKIKLLSLFFITPVRRELLNCLIRSEIYNVDEVIGLKLTDKERVLYLNPPRYIAYYRSPKDKDYIQKYSIKEKVGIAAILDDSSPKTYCKSHTIISSYIYFNDEVSNTDRDLTNMKLINSRSDAERYSNYDGNGCFTDEPETNFMNQGYHIVNTNKTEEMQYTTLTRRYPMVYRAIPNDHIYYPNNDITAVNITHILKVNTKLMNIVRNWNFYIYFGNDPSEFQEYCTIKCFIDENNIYDYVYVKLKLVTTTIPYTPETDSEYTGLQSIIVSDYKYKCLSFLHNRCIAYYNYDRL